MRLFAACLLQEHILTDRLMSNVFSDMAFARENSYQIRIVMALIWSLQFFGWNSRSCFTLTTSNFHFFLRWSSTHLCRRLFAKHSSTKCCCIWQMTEYNKTINACHLERIQISLLPKLNAEKRSERKKKKSFAKIKTRSQTFFDCTLHMQVSNKQQQPAAAAAMSDS